MRNPLNYRLAMLQHIIMLLCVCMSSCKTPQMQVSGTNIKPYYLNGESYFVSSMAKSSIMFHGYGDMLVLGVQHTMDTPINFDPSAIYIETGKGREIWAMSRKKYIKRLSTAAALNAFSSGLSRANYVNYGGANNFNQMVTNQQNLDQNLASLANADKNYLGLTTLQSGETHTGFVRIKLGSSKKLSWLYVPIGNEVHAIPFRMIK